MFANDFGIPLLLLCIVVSVTSAAPSTSWNDASGEAGGRVSLLHFYTTGIENWCSLQSSNWVGEEGLILTKKFVDAFETGLGQSPKLRDVVSEALAELGVSLDAFQEFLLDYIELWIKGDMVQDLIDELVEVEALIWISMNTGTAVCQGLLDQANNLVNQLLEHGECCILFEPWFWDQVSEMVCQILEGGNRFIGNCAASIENISQPQLRSSLEQLVLAFEDIILAAVDYPQWLSGFRQEKTHSGGDFSEEIHLVKKAVATWAQSVIDAGFSEEASLILEQLLQHLKEGSELIQGTIESSTGSLMDWILSSSCSLEGDGGILLHVTDEFELPTFAVPGAAASWQQRASGTRGSRGPDARNAGNEDVPAAGAAGKCPHLLQFVPSCVTPASPFTNSSNKGPGPYVGSWRKFPRWPGSLVDSRARISPTKDGRLLLEFGNSTYTLPMIAT